MLTAELTSLAFGETLAKLEVGVFLINSGGEVKVANPVAQGLLGENLTVSNGRLAARCDPEQTALQAAIESVVGDHSGSTLPIPRPIVLPGSGSDDYAVGYVLPVRNMRDHPIQQALLDSHALVVVRRAKRAAPLDPSLVRDLLNITLGEARVAALVGVGLQPKEVAEKLGIAETTTRTVLKRVFSKAGVTTQSDLAGLLSRLVLR